MFLALAMPQQLDNQVLGRWLTEDDDAIVELFLCGENLCGKIVDLKEKVYNSNDAQGMAGLAKVDRENPDANLRKRPILGLVILKGFVADGEGWRGGTIYDPDNGKTYRCKLRLIEKGKKLYVRGFVGVSLLGRTTYWRRAY